jgi:antitoxin HicB
MEEAQRIIRIPIEVEACKEGGFSVRSPMFPELISEGDTFDEAWRNAYDAAIAVLELYEDMGKKIPDKSFVQGPDPRSDDPARRKLGWDALVPV